MLSPKKFWHHAHEYFFADFLSVPMIFLLEWLFDGFVPRGNHNSKVLITDTSREIRKNGEIAVAALHLPTSCTSRQHLIVKDSNLSSSAKGPSAKINRTQREPLPLLWRVIFRMNSLFVSNILKGIDQETLRKTRKVRYVLRSSCVRFCFLPSLSWWPRMPATLTHMHAHERTVATARS